jgi:hypothetical protein
MIANGIDLIESKYDSQRLLRKDVTIFIAAEQLDVRSMKFNKKLPPFDQVLRKVVMENVGQINLFRYLSLL